MGSLPVLKPGEVAAILARLGFVEVRQRGSHKQFRDARGRGTTVPFHSGRDISPILLRQIARDIGLTVEEFRHLAIACISSCDAEIERLVVREEPAWHASLAG